MERYDESDFLLVAFTWVDKSLLFICSAWRYIRTIHLSATCVKRVYSIPFFDVLSNKRRRLVCSFLPVLRNVVSSLHLLLGSVDLNDASPVPSVDNRSLAVTHCTDLSHCRPIWNIVWSCLVTIFSCTWVAIHPNAPSPKNSWIEICIWNPLMSFAEHRLPLFVCAMLVPEYMLAWAIRQFFKAQEIAERNKGELETLGSVSIILSH